jgi:vesicular inhibitory amino acid transporter
LGVLSPDTYKLIGFFIVAPTTLLPLHLLSIPSIMSLVSSTVVILILLIDGFTKKTAPGSLVDPVHTSLGPDMTHANVLGGLGLLIAGFGGHAIIPSLAIDMKDPRKFNKVSLLPAPAPGHPRIAELRSTPHRSATSPT